MPRRAVLPRTGTLAVLATLACSGAALAHGGTDQQLRTEETQALGADHAAEHAHARQANDGLRARLAKLGPEGRRRWRAAERAAERKAVTQARARVAGKPRNEVGEWSERYGLPDYVMHAALTHTGEIAMWGWNPAGAGGVRPLEGKTWFWDTNRTLPALTGADTNNALRPDHPPAMTVGAQTVAAPLYCSGLSWLPDGRLLVAGGNKAFPTGTAAEGKGWAGLNTLFIYDPVTKQWTRAPDMYAGRWYPTQVMLADGRTYIGGGLDETGHETLPTDAEIYDPASNSLKRIVPPAPQGQTNVDLWGIPGWPGMYPHGFLMPGGRVMIVPDEYSRATALMTLPKDGAPTYVHDGQLPFTGDRHGREGSSAVLLPSATGASSTVMQLGGFAYTIPGSPLPDGVAKATTRTITPDTLPTPLPYRPAASMHTGRSYHNTVILPGGDLVTVGGAAGNDPNTDPVTGQRIYWDHDRDPNLLAAERYDHRMGTWNVLAPQQSFRGYHSVALLLPDGRIWSAGDDFHSDLVKAQTSSPWIGNAEIYAPPYLFGATNPATGQFDPDRPAVRPAITAAPKKVAAGTAFTVRTSGPEVTDLVLMGAGTPTHSVDPSQRQVRLTITGRSGDAVRAVLPGDATTAPHGYYMLFALTERGTPSHASWVRVGTESDPEPPVELPGTRPDPHVDRHPAPVPPTAPKATTPKLRVTLTLESQKRSRLLKTGRISVKVKANRAVRVRLTARLRDRAAASAVVHPATTKTATVRLRLNAAGRRILARKGRMTLIVRAHSLNGTRQAGQSRPV